MASLTAFLSDLLESVQKRALRIIFTGAETYSEALQLAGITSLAGRRHDLCIKYMNKMRQKGHPLNHLLPKQIENSCNYNLRQDKNEYYKFKNSTFCKTKRTDSFFTFKYFKP